MNTLDLSSIVAGIAAFGVTYILMPGVARLARRHALVDQPDDDRRIHSAATPRTGGIAVWFGIFAGVLVSLFMVVGLNANADAMALPFSIPAALSILAGSSVAALIGFYDDMRPLGATVKLLAQVVAASPLLASVEFVHSVATLLGGGPVAEVAAYPLIIFWVVFIMNAINLIDGLDGLAGGLAVILISFMVIMGGLTGGPLLLALAMMGAVLAFLRFNLPPARVFMGDTGSLLIGYVLAVLSLVVLQADPTTDRAMAILVLFGLPGLDTMMAVVRRLALGRSPMTADADHIHHRMLERGSGVHSRAVTSMYLIGLTLGLFALLIAFGGSRAASLAVGLVCALGLLLLWDLRYFDITSYSNLLRTPIQTQKDVQRRSVTSPSRARTEMRGPVKRGVSTS